MVIQFLSSGPRTTWSPKPRRCSTPLSPEGALGLPRRPLEDHAPAGRAAEVLLVVAPYWFLRSSTHRPRCRPFRLLLRGGPAGAASVASRSATTPRHPGFGRSPSGGAYHTAAGVARSLFSLALPPPDWTCRSFRSARRLSSCPVAVAGRGRVVLARLNPRALATPSSQAALERRLPCFSTHGFDDRLVSFDWLVAVSGVPIFTITSASKNACQTAHFPPPRAPRALLSTTSPALDAFRSVLGRRVPHVRYPDWRVTERRSTALVARSTSKETLRPANA